MKIKRALIVYKKTRYQKLVLEQKSAHHRHLVRRADLSVEEWTRLHEEHNETLELVKATLRGFGIPFRTYSRFHIKEPRKADLFITVGGDGTFLQTAHSVGSQLMFGVNSTPGSSVGHFTAANADNFEQKLTRVLSGKHPIKKIQRLQAYRDRIKLGPPAINEYLFTSRNAGATSRYWIGEVHGTKKLPAEEHKSSGVWIATASGSTAAIRSAGGKRLPMEALKFQYWVRELYRLSGQKYRYQNKILQADDALQITTKMEDGHLFVDGPHLRLPLKRGETVTFRLAKVPLRMVA